MSCVYRSVTGDKPRLCKGDPRGVEKCFKVDLSRVADLGNEQEGWWKRPRKRPRGRYTNGLLNPAGAKSTVQ